MRHVRPCPECDGKGCLYYRWEGLWGEIYWSCCGCEHCHGVGKIGPVAAHPLEPGPGR